MQKLLINKGEKKYYEITNENISALSIAISSNNVGAIFADLQNTNIVLSLRSNKKEVKKIFQGDFKELVEIFSSTNKAFRFTALTDSGYYHIPFDFGTVLNLNKELSLYVEIENSLFSATADTAVISVNTVQDIGIMAFIPVIEKINLESTKSEHDLDLGSFVKKVVFNPNGNAANITQMLVDCDKLKAEYNKQTLFLPSFVHGVATSFVDYTVSYDLLHFRHVLNKLMIKLTFSTAASNRVIYVVRNIMTSEIANNLVKKSAIHNQQNLQFIRDIKTVDCGCK